MAMNPEDSQLPVEPAAPMALPYASLGPSRPALITAIGVMGIIVASLGLIVAVFGALSAVSTMFMVRAIPAMQWQTTGAMAVAICEAIVGAALAVTLLTGSTGLLRLRMEPQGVALVGLGLSIERRHLSISPDFHRRAESGRHVHEFNCVDARRFGDAGDVTVNQRHRLLRRRHSDNHGNRRRAGCAIACANSGLYENGICDRGCRQSRYLLHLSDRDAGHHANENCPFGVGG